MKEKRNCMERLIFIILLPVFMAAVILPAIKADAASAGGSQAIGMYVDNIGGESTTGVKISKNGQVVHYALDTWKKTGDDEWKYTGSNIYGSVQEIESSVNSTVYIKGIYGTRFGINIDKIREYMPENGSVVIKKYVYGKCTYNDAEFTYQDTEDNPVDISESLLKQLEGGISKLDLTSTKYGYDGVSYIYDIYDAAVINRNGDIYADIPSGCTILSNGYAYYGVEDGYLIKELPQVIHDPSEGYTFGFKGWYTRPSGGNEVHTGDVIELGTTIYPQWNVSLNSYNVNCTDILGSSPEGQVLGTTSWTVNYNDNASGSDIGSDSAAGVYYKGFCYTGCTSVTVENDSDVYRYFRPVSYNIIFNGNKAVSGETVSLYGCLYGEKYMLEENGFNRNGTVILDLNAEDAFCATKSVNVPYKFTGWADTASGKAIYADGEEVINLCEMDGEKHLYAVWEGGSAEINTIPVREGYNFDGWSEDKDGTTGNTWFDVSDGNNCTLYAIWKPLRAKYSVAYYIENSNGEYILDQKVEYGSFTGKEADCSSSLYIEEYYSQYIMDKDKSIYKGIVRFDGSLLLECYLKRKTGNNGNGESDVTTGGSIGDSTNPGNGNEGTPGDSGSTEGGNEGTIESGSNTGNNGDSTITTGGSIGDSGNTGGNGSAGNTSGGSIGSSGNTGGNGSTGNTSGGSIGGSGNTGENVTPGNTGGSTGSGGAGTGNSNSAGAGSISNSGTGGSTGGGSGSSPGGTGSSGSGAGSAGTNSGSTSNTTGSSIGSGNTGNGSISSGNNNSGSGTTNNNKEDNTGNTENTVKKKGSSKRKKSSYPKAGKRYTRSGIIYKVIKSSSKTKTVKIIKAKKKISKARVPAFIKIKGYKYKVVSIAKNAFARCSKLKEAVVGKNIKCIGKKAFYKNKGLGNIKIKSKKLKNIGKDAFKSIKPGCVVKIAGSRKYAQKVFSMISAKN